MLQLDRVRAGYRQTTVLHDVTLSVPEGRVVALLGPNGAGKTTLLRVASGLLEPSAGHLRMDGVPLVRSAPHDLVARGVCHIPEGRGVFRSMTVRENLLIGSRRADALDRAAEIFPVLGQRMQQVAGTLSGGEQQMLAVTRAYLAQPRYVLLDEVSLGLAPKIVDEIFGFLHRLAAEGAALLLVEQYVTRALAIADLVYVLNQGRIGFAGEPGELDVEQVFRTYVGAAG